MIRTLLFGVIIASMGCAVVPQNRRQYLADPTMQPNECPLEAQAKRKYRTAREGASGGDGQSAGGGCGCSN
jgi:hypothetical protein